MELKKLERKLLDKKPIEADIEDVTDLWQKSLAAYLEDVKRKL
jgi:hypothetical protein